MPGRHVRVTLLGLGASGIFYTTQSDCDLAHGPEHKETTEQRPQAHLHHKKRRRKHRVGDIDFFHCCVRRFLVVVNMWMCASASSSVMFVEMLSVHHSRRKLLTVAFSSVFVCSCVCVCVRSRVCFRSRMCSFVACSLCVCVMCVCEQTADIEEARVANAAPALAPAVERVAQAQVTGCGNDARDPTVAGCRSTRRRP